MMTCLEPIKILIHQSIIVLPMGRDTPTSGVREADSHNYVSHTQTTLLVCGSEITTRL